MGKNKISIGNSGEYFVAAELERRGFSVAVPMSNTELFDILAFNRTSQKLWAIQVKTSSLKDNKWALTKKNETITGDNIVYCLVKLNQLGNPEYHIVPSKVVAKEIHDIHVGYLNTPGKKGQVHKDTDMRNFFDRNNTWKDKWDLLN